MESFRCNIVEFGGVNGGNKERTGLILHKLPNGRIIPYRNAYSRLILQRLLPCTLSHGKRQHGSCIG